MHHATLFLYHFSSGRMAMVQMPCDLTKKIHKNSYDIKAESRTKSDACSLNLRKKAQKRNSADSD